jgi:GTP cyclohydrolase FolE2
MVETGKLRVKPKDGKGFLAIDVQNQKPENEIELEKVGIEGLRKLVSLKRAKATYNVIVTINSYITLPANLRGVHMSRFVESVKETPTTASSIEDLAELISKQALEKHGFDSQTEVFGELPYERVRPSGEKESSIAQMFAKYSTKTKKKTAGIQIGGALACPCSKEMCNGLTHNQRGSLSVEIDSNQKTQLLDIIEICSQSFSSPLFSLLKRSEEKKVVEQMHENARFVEDVTRKCVQLLKEKYPGRYCKVKCVSIESIHDHNVFSEWRGIL